MTLEGVVMLGIVIGLTARAFGSLLLSATPIRSGLCKTCPARRASTGDRKL
jgi:hypothetical protein